MLLPRSPWREGEGYTRQQDRQTWPRACNPRTSLHLLCYVGAEAGQQGIRWGRRRCCVPVLLQRPTGCRISPGPARCGSRDAGLPLEALPLPESPQALPLRLGLCTNASSAGCSCLSRPEPLLLAVVLLFFAVRGRLALRGGVGGHKVLPCYTPVQHGTLTLTTGQPAPARAHPCHIGKFNS